jgi:hypothetical protein
VRTNTRFVLISAAGLIVAACSGKDAKMSDDLKKDLDQASTSDGLALANASKGSQVVSAIEQATPPAPRQVAPSRRVAKHTAAPTRTPAPVETRQADVSEAVVQQPTEVAPAPVEPAPTQSPRPQPIQVSTGNVSVGRSGGSGGSGLGAILGGISIVLRGGGVDGDSCDPRTDGRRGGIGGSINQRIPVIYGGPSTFPGSGRIGHGRR